MAVALEIEIENIRHCVLRIGDTTTLQRRMASSLYKIPPLLAAAYTTGVALTAPVPPPNKKEVKHDVSTREKAFRPLVRLITTTLKVRVVRAHSYSPFDACCS